MKLKTNNQSRSLVAGFFVAVMIFGTFFFNVHSVHAAWWNPLDWFGSAVGGIVDALLVAILKFMGLLVSAAAVIFTYIIDPGNNSKVMDNDVVYQIWALVRDTLNVAFILGILFCAFCTVFQVEKFSYKKILLTIILMALLVNFSFPISRFIIDLSNVIMYYFLNGLDFGGDQNKLFTKIADDSGLNNILNPSSNGTAYLIAAIIFTFLFAVTLLFIGIMFIIRLVALTILIIFSPIAFVGSIIPFLSSKASSWWDNLFKYSFFGPIMVFMLYVSTKMMVAAKDLAAISQQGGAQQGGVQDGNIVGAIAFFAVPIVILWMGIGVAQSMSIAGAGAAKKFSMGAVSAVSGVNFAKKTWGAYQTRRKEASKDAWSTKLGTLAGSKQDQLYGWAGKKAGKVPGVGKMGLGQDAALRYQRDMAGRVENETKRLDTANKTTGDLKQVAQTGNRYQKAAAIQELANRGQATAQQLQEVKTAFGETAQVFHQVANKVKAYDPVAAFATAIDADGKVTAFDKNKMNDHMDSNQFDAKKVNASTLGNADFMEMAFQNQAISNKDLEELRGKSIGHENNIKGSLEAIAGKFNYLADAPPGLAPEEKAKHDQQQRINRGVQMAYFAQQGKLHESIEGNVNYENQIFGRLNKDTMKRIKLDTAENHYDQIASNMNISSYKNAITEVEDRAAQKTLNENIMETDFARAGNSEAEALRQAVRKDVRLRNIKNA